MPRDGKAGEEHRIPRQELARELVLKVAQEALVANFVGVRLSVGGLAIVAVNADRIGSPLF